MRRRNFRHQSDVWCKLCHCPSTRLTLTSPSDLTVLPWGVSLGLFWLHGTREPQTITHTRSQARCLVLRRENTICFPGAMADAGSNHSDFVYLLNVKVLPNFRVVPEMNECFDIMLRQVWVSSFSVSHVGWWCSQMHSPRLLLFFSVVDKWLGCVFPNTQGLVDSSPPPHPSLFWHLCIQAESRTPGESVTGGSGDRYALCVVTGFGQVRRSQTSRLFLNVSQATFITRLSVPP